MSDTVRWRDWEEEAQEQEQEQEERRKRNFADHTSLTALYLCESFCCKNVEEGRQIRKWRDFLQSHGIENVSPQAILAFSDFLTQLFVFN